MLIEETHLEGVLLVTPRRLADNRGFFAETYSARVMAEHGISDQFVQDNHSASTKASTIRGLHYQAPPHAQDKLVRCTRGSILDAVVDARVGSPQFGRWIIAELSAENGRQLFVPKGFLHGFLTLTPNAEIQYKVSDYYHAGCDGSVRWDSLGIDWGLNEHPILSQKDLDAPPFDQWESPFIYQAP